MKLYEIDKEMMECVDLETGEIIDIERLEELQLARDEKIENVCLWIKNLNAEADALKAEKLEFANRQKTAENKVESLKRYVNEALGGEKFVTTKVKVSYRKSEKVEIEDVSKIPNEYLILKEPDVDKKAVKQAIKQGEIIEGAYITENLNIQIK